VGHWNYRICRKKAENADVYNYGIHEAYYNKDGSIWAVTDNAVSVGFDEFEKADDVAAIESMTRTLEWMKLALNKSIIDLDIFVFTSHSGDNDG
jgi:hypothetical protein